MKKFLALLISVMMVLSLVACGNKTEAPKTESTAPAAPAATPAFKPGKKVEVLVPNAAGGGTDIFARKTVDIINKNNLVPGTTFEVVNKGGASGSIAGAYALTQKGNDNMIIFASTAFWTTPLSGKADYSYTEFTPLVEMSEDVLVLCVGKTSGYKDLDSFVKGAKSADGKVSFCSSSLTSEGGLLSIAFQKVTGAKTKYVPYDSGGEAVTAVMGGHVTATWANYGEISQSLETGDLIAIAVATDNRIKELPNVPTMKEKGYDLTLVQYRHIAAAPNMSKEAAEYWSDIFYKVFQTAEFDEYVKDNALNPNFVGYKDWQNKYLEIGDMFKPLIEEALASGM